MFRRGVAQGDAVPPLQTVIGLDGPCIDRHPPFRYPRLDEGTGPFSLRRYDFVHPLTGPCIFHLPLVRLFSFRHTHGSSSTSTFSRSTDFACFASRSVSNNSSPTPITMHESATLKMGKWMRRKSKKSTTS